MLNLLRLPAFGGGAVGTPGRMTVHMAGLIDCQFNALGITGLRFATGRGGSCCERIGSNWCIYTNRVVSFWRVLREITFTTDVGKFLCPTTLHVLRGAV